MSYKFKFHANNSLIQFIRVDVVEIILEKDKSKYGAINRFYKREIDKNRKEKGRCNY